jgi:UDP:flavonoid glycosyltransferase YjiC (YdhE family)
VLIQTALEALASEEVTLAVSTAAHDPSRFQPPTNSRLERWLPHQSTIDKAACVICHGGMGITQKALAAGVPVCVVPFGRDQFEVAKRVIATDAGTMVPPDSLTPDSLRAAVGQTMLMRAGAEQVAASFAGAGGTTAASNAIESLSDTTANGRPLNTTAAL